ncbi:MAG: DUF1049 domain-containing protein [Acidimicrobiia bacterium]|nr:DUF1049 domain-containing protein [Acidimicrobiia bacterium]
MADIPDIPIPDSTQGVGIPTGEPGRKPGRDIAFPWRLVSALAVFGIIVIFALQNTKSVDVNFLFWDFGIPLIVVITATTVLSVVFGDMIDWWWKRRKKKRSEDA